MLIDSHAHLNDERLSLRAKEIVDNFKNDNIECCIIVGASLESSILALKQAHEYNQYALIGTHPEDIREINDETIEKYRQMAQDEKVVGIGEIGLDYHYEDGEPRDKQIEAFTRQVVLADELKLPISLHIRDAYGDALDILNKYEKYLNSGVLLHCYSGSCEMVREFSKFDCYFALGGSITFKNAKKEDVIKAIDKDRLLLETDCPYMAPTPFRGQTNEPKYIKLVAEKIAQVLNEDIEDVIDRTNKNTKRLFKRMK